jgi:predicted Zn-dependent protease
MRHQCLMVGSVAFVAALASSARCQISPPQSSSSQVGKEWTLGQHPAQDLEIKDGKIDDATIVGYLQRIENQIALAVGAKPFEVRLTRSSDQYASLFSNGVLYISGGLLERIESEAELAGLLSHQLAHMEQKTTEGRQPACILESQIGRAEDQRELELQATAAAVRHLKVAGYEPSAVLDLLSKLAYEHPGWAKAILPEDLLNLRVTLETDAPPSAGYLIDSSEFIQQHTKLLAVLGHSSTEKKRKHPSLASPEVPFR